MASNCDAQKINIHFISSAFASAILDSTYAISALVASIFEFSSSFSLSLASTNSTNAFASCSPSLVLSKLNNYISETIIAHDFIQR